LDLFDDMTKLLVLNYGSSSLKYALFSIRGKKIVKKLFEKQVLPNQWNKIWSELKTTPIDTVGFRVVHGGQKYFNTTELSTTVISDLSKYNHLAPLHNPPALKLIKQVKKSLPKAKMAASFDTGWFKSLPETSYLYSIPIKYYQKFGVRKYGFHGLSHEAATEYALQKLAVKKPTIITCHLGAGASITWYHEGRVKDTTMGFSPNEGLTMATRSGDVPANLVLYLLDVGMNRAQVDDLLNKRSGLLGLAGAADLRQVLSLSKKRRSAKLAVQIYIYDIQRYLASYVAMSRKVFAIVFTGAVSQNPKIIKMILAGLSLPKGVKIWVYKGGEMENIAKKTIKCLSK